MKRFSGNSKPLLIVLVALLLTTVSSSDNFLTSSWAKLQISPDTLCSMPYGNFRVSIYEHSDNKKTSTQQSRQKYFYAPIALLDHKSAVSSFNNVTKQAEMRFRIEMWNEKVEREVVNYLSDVVGQQVKPHQVHVIPLEKVVLSSTIPSSTYSLSTNWLPYQLHKELSFTLSCFAQKDCDQLAVDMRTSPEQFEHFKLLFSLSSQTSQTKQTTIRIDNIVSGQMVSKLLQEFGEQKEALLTAEDTKRLLMETTTNVLVETFDDSDVVSSISKSQIYNILQDLLAFSRVTITKESNNMWESVFWNDDNYRPDKTSKKLNEIYKKQETVTQRKIVDVYKNTDSGGVNVGFSGFSLGLTDDSTSEGSISKDDLNRLYEESKNYVEWDGEAFVPKPLSLSRINLAQLRDRQSLQDRSVRVRYSTAVLSTPINFVQNAALTITDEWREHQITVATMQKELNDLKSTLLSGISAANKRISGILASNICMVQIDTEEKHNSSIATLRKKLDDSATTEICFHAYRTTIVNPNYGNLAYEGIGVNVGNAMNIATGVFTAPKPGIYLFTFHAAKNSRDLWASLNLNDISQTSMFTGTTHHAWDISGAMSAILSLKVNDRVAVSVNGEVSRRSITSFSGVLLKEKK